MSDFTSSQPDIDDEENMDWDEGKKGKEDLDQESFQAAKKYLVKDTVVQKILIMPEMEEKTINELKIVSIPHPRTGRKIRFLLQSINHKIKKNDSSFIN